MADVGRSAPWWGGGHDLTPIRLIILVAAVATLVSLLLTGVLMGAQGVAYMIQNLIDGIWARGG